MYSFTRTILSVLATIALTGFMPATAAPNQDGVTYEELESALQAGLQVERATSSKGDKFLYAKGKHHLIAAFLTHCGTSTRCEGVTYFAVLKEKPSASFVNQFNRDFDYVKFYLNEEDSGIISVQQHVQGGVTSDNILQNALILMVRMTDYAKAANVTIALGPNGPTSYLRAPLRNLLAQEAVGNTRYNSNRISLDPVLARAMTHHMDTMR
ncbi:MAG: YbjN domain-containing protein [Micropepsaceae bacterium]